MSELSAEKLGLARVGKVFHNLSYAQLFEHEVANNEGHVLSSNTMTVDTGKFTGRSPKDKFFVQQTPSSDHIAWGSVNKPVTTEIFDELRAKIFTSRTVIAALMRTPASLSVLLQNLHGNPIL